MEINIWIVLLVVCIILLSMPTKCNMWEHFASISSGNYKEMCPSCYSKSPKDCLTCLNCGVGINDKGKMSCVPGDSNGPFFREPNVKYYAYGKQWRNKLRPQFQVKSIYPYNIWHEDHPKYLI